MLSDKRVEVIVSGIVEDMSRNLPEREILYHTLIEKKICDPETAVDTVKKVHPPIKMNLSRAKDISVQLGQKYELSTHQMGIVIKRWLRKYPRVEFEENNDFFVNGYASGMSPLLYMPSTSAPEISFEDRAKMIRENMNKLVGEVKR